MSPTLKARFEKAREHARKIGSVAAHAADNIDRAPQMVREVGKWAAAGAKITAPEVLDYRQSICNACEKWKPLPNSDVMHCLECKCLKWKLMLSTSKCPLGKWTE